MPTRATFAEVLEAVDNLPPDEQVDLVAVVQKRLAERGRERVIADVPQGERDFAAGLCQPKSVDEIMREID